MSFQILWKKEERLADHDFVVLELGVLHYFADLLSLFSLVNDALKEDRTFNLRDYHPFAAKIINVSEDEVYADGNYFDRDIIKVDVSYSILLPEKKRST